MMCRLNTCGTGKRERATQMQSCLEQEGAGKRREDG